MTRDEANMVRKLLRGSRLMLDVDTLRNKVQPWFGAGLFFVGLSFGLNINAPAWLALVVSCAAAGCGAWSLRYTFQLRARLLAFKAEQEAAEAEEPEPAPYRAVLNLVDDDGTEHRFDSPEAMVDFVVTRAVAAGEIPPELAEELTASGLRQLRRAIEQEAAPPPRNRQH